MPVKRLSAPPLPLFACLSYPDLFLANFILLHHTSKLCTLTHSKSFPCTKSFEDVTGAAQGGRRRARPSPRVSSFTRDSLRRSPQTQLPRQIHLHLVYLWGSQLPWRVSFSWYIISSQSPRDCMGKEILLPIKKRKKKKESFSCLLLATLTLSH